MELPACDLAEDLIVTALGSLWSGNFLSSGELPSGNDQKLFTSISAGFQYPDGVFDQDNRRETWVKNATLANGFLWTTSVAHATTVAKNLHLECYRKNPNVQYWPLSKDGTPVRPPSSSEGSKEAGSSSRATRVWYTSPAITLIVGALVLSFSA